MHGKKSRLVFIAYLLLGLSWPLWAAGKKPQIAELEAHPMKGSLLVSFRLVNAFPPSLRERIDNGLTVVFVHRVRLVRNRTGWFDKNILEKIVRVGLHFDALTHQYFLTREVSGWPQNEWATENFQEAADWMTLPFDISLCSLSEVKGKSVFIQVKTVLMKRKLFHVFPWDLNTGWAKAPLIFTHE